MSKQFPIGWCEEAGRLAGEHDRGAFLTAVRPRLWKPGTRAQQHERSRRAGVSGGAATKLDRKLDEAMGVDAEGEE
jgi:hypothetical protein